MQVALREGEKFDVILSDWNMPGMSGIQLLELVKADPKLKKIIFVMVTAESIQEQKNAAMQLGCDHYLTKPVAPAEIEKILRTIF